MTTNKFGLPSRVVCIAVWLLVTDRLLTGALMADDSVARDDARQDSSPPNVVLIISDDQAWNDYGFMGHSEIETPNLDRLAREGARFDRGYVPTALCRPSLATLLTGHYASSHGITGNDPSPKYAAVGSDLYKVRCEELISNIDRFKTLPARLKEVGYLSHQSGKLWEGSFQRSGFTHGMTRGFPQQGGRHGDDGLTIGRKGIEPIRDFLDEAQEQSKPFFLWYAPFLPHEPHNPPPRLLKKYTAKTESLPLAKYYAMCEWFDETCGELIGEIEHRKLSENTLIVYVTDNGWIQNIDRRGFAPRSKQSPNEGGIRTPILYHWPNKIAPQQRQELATSLDIPATILAAAGAEVPEELPGLNLLPHLLDQTEIQRDQIYGEGFAHDIADLSDPSASLLYLWTIKGRWKLLLGQDGEVNRYASAHADRSSSPQLFDLQSDPSEMENVAEDHPKLVAEMTKDIADYWKP
ncbi:sulfatase [Rubripirellula amarantea]|nr:sulfatase [Rubripirellula amarantea]